MDKVKYLLRNADSQKISDSEIIELVKKIYSKIKINISSTESEYRVWNSHVKEISEIINLFNLTKMSFARFTNKCELPHAQFNCFKNGKRVGYGDWPKLQSLIGIKPKLKLVEKFVLPGNAQSNNHESTTNMKNFTKNKDHFVSIRYQLSIEEIEILELLSIDKEMKFSYNFMKNYFAFDVDSFLDFMCKLQLISKDEINQYQIVEQNFSVSDVVIK